MGIQAYRQRVIDTFPKNGTGAEIGVFQGAFSEALVETVSPNKLYLIDPWENFDDPALKRTWYHKFSAQDMNDVYQGVLKRFEKQIEAGKIKVLRRKSQDVIDEIPADSLDFCYIDGDHRFEGVLDDMEISAPKVKNRGLIVLDDHKLGSWWGDGVIRAMDTFLGHHPADWKVSMVAHTQVVIQKIAGG